MTQDFSDMLRIGIKTAKDRINHIQSPTLRLGVTGLTRAGKTVFITSFVQNLLARKNLPFFSPLQSGRIKAVYLAPQPDEHLPRFAIEDHLTALSSSPPSWPKATASLSQLRLIIEYETDNLLKQSLKMNRLNIDLIDYPGEWLLDLQLLDLSYETWAKQALETAKELEHLKEAKAWLEDIQKIDPGQKRNEALADKLATSFRAFMIAARRSKDNLITLPPGRFLTPGDMAGSPALSFAPLIKPVDDKLTNDKPGEQNSLWDLMKQRFEAYKTHVVKPFYLNHFTRLDRQIVLVDILDGLNKGSKALTRLEQGLEAILKNFNVGTNNWISQFWTRPIDRLIFAATKADHIHHTSHQQMQNLISELVDRAQKRADYKGASVFKIAMASLRATREGEFEQDGEILPCIIGRPQKGEMIDGELYDGTKEIAFFPGDLSDELNHYMGDQEEIKPDSQPFQFVKFAPPPRDEKKQDDEQMPLPHIRLDRVIDLLLEDYLK